MVTSHGALLAFDHLRHRRDENGCGNIAGVSTSFATLSTDHVNADIQTFLNMFWVADHVHVEDAGFVEAFDNMLGWNTDGGDEEFGAAVDDDADKFVKFAFGVVIAR